MGVLGHVDSGKTSLVKSLSTLLSTAALDKSSQSRQRGITLDLGFSAFLTPLPASLVDLLSSQSQSVPVSLPKEKSSGHSSSSSSSSKDSSLPSAAGAAGTNIFNPLPYDCLQVTLVDCPGHASLIRTIIGGAQIIDMILLVVDATKGIQAQTAECIVIAELTTSNLIIVLNKIDLFKEEEREEKLRIVKEKIGRVLRGTKFRGVDMVGISACVGGEKVASGSAAGGTTNTGEGSNNSNSNSNNGDNSNKSNNNNHATTTTPNNTTTNTTNNTPTYNIEGLLNLLRSRIIPPNRSQYSSKNFHFAIDHCFAIRGQGTVFTGTCLAGSIEVNDTIEFPALQTQRRIKSMQMFRRKVQRVGQGDRAGICVSNLDPNLMERGVAATPDSVRLVPGAIALVRKVRYYGGALSSGTKFHLSVGHTTVMATVTFWGAAEIKERRRRMTAEKDGNNTNNNGDANNNASLTSSSSSPLDGGNSGIPTDLEFDYEEHFHQQEDYLERFNDHSSLLGGMDTIMDQSNNNNDSTTMTTSQTTTTTTAANTTTTTPSIPKGGGGSNNNNINQLPLHWASIEFQSPVHCPLGSLIIGSRLDADVVMHSGSGGGGGGGSSHGNHHHHGSNHNRGGGGASSCRLAFSGRLMERYDANVDRDRINLYVDKERFGTVCRLGDPYKRDVDGQIVRYEVYGTDLFKKETSIHQFVGMKICCYGGGNGSNNNEDLEVGILQSSFGTSGKFRVKFPGGTRVREGGKLYLRFRRYANDKDKKMRQGEILPIPAAKSGTRLVVNNDSPTKKNRRGVKKKGGVGGGGNNNNNNNNGAAIADVEQGKKGKIGSIQKISGAAESCSTSPSTTSNPTPNGDVGKKIGIISVLKGEPWIKNKDCDGNNTDSNNSSNTEHKTRYPLAIVSGLFTPDVDIRQKYIGAKVNVLLNGKKEVVGGGIDDKDRQVGNILGPFGKAGKCKVEFPLGVYSPVGTKVELVL